MKLRNSEKSIEVTRNAVEVAIVHTHVHTNIYIYILTIDILTDSSTICMYPIMTRPPLTMFVLDILYIT